MIQGLILVIRIIGLLLTIVPAILVFAHVINLEMHKVLMLIGCVMWFGPVFVQSLSRPTNDSG